MIILVLVWRKSIGYTFDEDMREKTIFTFSFSVTLIALTCRPQICSPGYYCPWSYLHKIRSFFPFLTKTEASGAHEELIRLYL